MTKQVAQGIFQPESVPSRLALAASVDQRPASIPGIEYWRARPESITRELTEVFGVLGAVTLAGWFVPVSYHAFGHIYLLMVIALSLRVGRRSALVAAVLSGVAWNFVFMPPRLSFSVLDLDDGLLLGTYFVAALIGGQLTARIRAEERRKRQLEQRAAALFHLTRELAAARTFDEAVTGALRQADDLFDARTALRLIDAGGHYITHAAGSLCLNEREFALAELARQNARPTGKFTADRLAGDGLHVPLLRGDVVVGVLSIALRTELDWLSSTQSDLIAGFAAQIALLVEREQLRAAGEREKLLAESDRLHRTLLDSVSHELKTPLAVLRAAAEKLDTNDVMKRTRLIDEVQVATCRLDWLVANLLNQTRLEAGALKPQPDWCDARDLIGAARRAVGSALSGHTVLVDAPLDLPLFHGDAVLMEQVLANLLLNAALHTPAGTVVRVKAGVEADHQRVFFTVSDNGPGIPAELQAELFHKFRRGREAPTGGLGLGLSIVRGFMLAQGGDVQVGRGPDGGACFTVQLPHSMHGAVPGDEY